MYTQTEWQAKKQKEMDDLLNRTPLILLEFYDKIDVLEDDLFEGFSYAVRCQASMSSYMSEDGFKWICANLQVFHEDNRIAVYEGTPGIGLYGASHAVPLPFDVNRMYDLVHKAEQLFPSVLERLRNPE